MLTLREKTKDGSLLSDQDCRGELIVDAVAAILDGDDAGLSSAGDYGDGFTGVATQGEEKSVQFFVIGFDVCNDVFFSELRGP